MLDMADNFEDYKKAVFLIGEGRVDWGAEFAVITAYNPDGASPVGGAGAQGHGGSGARFDSEAERLAEAERLNQAAHVRLKADMPGACEVTGCSPDLVHRELGWAANITLPEALRLGRLYRQDAIFWVSGGALYIVDVRTSPAARLLSGAAAPEMPTMELLGPWLERVR